MAVETPPLATQAGSFGAEQLRRGLFAWAARTGTNAPGIIAGGLLSSADCQLSAPGSGMSVNVGTGEMLIGGSEGGSQGGYGPCRITSTTNLTIATSNPSNPRVDTVVGTVNDAAYGTPAGTITSGNWGAQVITGSPTSGANLTNLSGAGAVPLSSLLIGYVLVPAGSSNVTSGNISNRATVVPLLPNLNYLRVPNGTIGLVTWGLFQTGSGTIVNGGSGDWTLSGLSTGIATVNFPTRNVQPAVVATIDTGGSGIYSTVAASAIATNSATITTWNISSTLPPPQVNAYVSFAVIG